MRIFQNPSPFSKGEVSGSKPRYHSVATANPATAGPSMDLEETYYRKLATLQPEFLQLVRETKTLKQRLRRTRGKREKLNAEVRFLRRRLKLLKKNSALSEKSCAIMPVETTPEMWPFEEEIVEPEETLDMKKQKSGFPLPWGNGGGGGEAEPRKSTITIVSPATATTKLTIQVPASTTIKPTTEGGGPVSALKSSTFKGDNSMASSRTGKRRITWQDEISLGA
ncbi:uncharacterized protein LOC18434714 [Amborella trichopoda]|uniref:Uncharacterized protein n=1 Tax=Amborella trichopoda TaxID=13333 RepID=W1PHC5_AMBTC|nr:uncharacterized protein LOC18434714 [Amborella trichopoda]ERN06515.1 hypothetical protein AMTR_s00058p00082370 [Amborella trichopoda]|eukprot:XP_006844840.1 uncharacterized protein LOC18434714 [Amborella trichopoda]